MVVVVVVVVVVVTQCACKLELLFLSKILMVLQSCSGGQGAGKIAKQSWSSCPCPISSPTS